MDKNTIILGAGEVYMTEFTGTTIPEDSTIETEENNVGHCSGGFSVDYKPTKYDVKNQYGKTVKSFITEESVTCKTGILSWNIENLERLSTGTLTTTAGTAAGSGTSETPTKKKLVIGGGNKIMVVLLRFVHVKEDGRKIRFTMIGQAGGGFALEFAQKELVVDAEITAIEKIEDTLCILEEEVPVSTT